jgi:hypothetical protein
MTKLLIFAGNTTEVQLTGIQNADTLEYLTGSNITATLHTTTGNIVSGANAIPMLDVANANGSVNCVISGSTILAEGSYYIIFNGTVVTGDTFTLYQPVEVRVRK